MEGEKRVRRVYFNEEFGDQNEGQNSHNYYVFTCKATLLLFLHCKTICICRPRNTIERHAFLIEPTKPP